MPKSDELAPRPVMTGIPVWKRFTTSRPDDVNATGAARHPFVIVGGGPVGLTMALDLACYGHPVVVLNALDFIPAGSKAICFAKRSLDIYTRLGIGERLVDKGVVWNTGKVFWRDDPKPIYEFDLLPIKDQQNPAFINLQQYYLEEYLVDALADYPQVDIRWGNRLTALEPRADGVTRPLSARPALTS